MSRFAFILNPYNISNVHDQFPLTRMLPQALVKSCLGMMPPFVLHTTDKLRSAAGNEIEGCFIACPMLSRQALEIKETAVLDKIFQAMELARRSGAKIIGLGALMGVLGKGGQEQAERSAVAVTTGSSLAAAAILQTLEKAAALKNLRMSGTKAAIVGSTNAIGQNCGLGLLNKVDTVYLVARNPERLAEQQEFLISQKTGTKIIDKGLDLESVIREADILIFTTSAIEVPFTATANSLKKDAIICDIPSPRNIPRELRDARKDILVIDGAVIEPPASARTRLKLPLKNDFIFACMAETMILAFEGKTEEDFSLGFKPDPDKVSQIKALADKHGFLIKFTSFGEPINL